MMESEVVKCHQCGKKVSKQKTADPGAPKVGYECSKCHEWTCSNCTDWNVSEPGNWVCSECSGRVAPHKSECE
jgi:hypothetical protein